MLRVTVAVLLLAGLTGCYGTAASQAFHTAVGPTGEYMLIKNATTREEMAQYRIIEAVRTVSDVGEVLKPEVRKAARENIIKELESMKQIDEVKPVPAFIANPTYTPVLVIQTKVIAIDTDSLPGERILGEAERITIRTYFRDKGTGRLLLEANITGELRSVVDIDETHVGVGFARTLKKLFKKEFGWE